jgi:hypothetical protein
MVGPDNVEIARQRNPPLLRGMLDDVRSMPGVQVAALVGGGVPLRGDLQTIEFGIPGRVLPQGQDLDFNEISPDYFRALKVPLLKGRLFTNEDRQGSEPVVIINEAAATRFFPDSDPIGQTVVFLGVRRIVGVVGTSGTTDPRLSGAARGSFRSIRARLSVRRSFFAWRATRGPCCRRSRLRSGRGFPAFRSQTFRRSGSTWTHSSPSGASRCCYWAVRIVIGRRP